jgi:hypothetical protein
MHATYQRALGGQRARLLLQLWRYSSSVGHVSMDRTSLRRSLFQCFGLHRSIFPRFGAQYLQRMPSSNRKAGHCLHLCRRGFHFPAGAITGSELTSTSPPPRCAALKLRCCRLRRQATITNGNTTITEARLLLRMANRRRCLGHVHVEPGRVHLGVHSVRQAAGGGIRREPLLPSPNAARALTDIAESSIAQSTGETRCSYPKPSTW